MTKVAEDTSELLIRDTVDDEVDRAVEHRQVPGHHVHQELPFRAKILPSGGVETFNYQVITKKTI